MSKRIREDRKEYLKQIAEDMEAFVAANGWFEVWRCARKMGTLRLGPKRRRYDLISTVNPTVQEWCTHLAQDGKSGGWNAQLMTVTDEINDDIISKIPDQVEQQNNEHFSDGPLPPVVQSDRFDTDRQEHVSKKWLLTCVESDTN